MPAYTSYYFKIIIRYHDCMTSKGKQNHSPNKSNKKNKRKKRKSESSEEDISDSSEPEDEDELLVSEANTTARFQVHKNKIMIIIYLVIKLHEHNLNLT